MDFFSTTFIPTSRQIPKSAEAMSHILALRAGLLFMTSAGIYSYLPLGYKVLRNIENIIREEMDACSAQEIFMSALQPLELWQKTGRDRDLEEVLLCTKDRRGREFCLGPTHEELVTEIVKKHISSYKQLPITLYQIQTKFRDEPRPRFGLMRGCEFMMKDAYSFDSDQNGLHASYEKMKHAYLEIFRRCGLQFTMVEADSGAMGGKVSHEYMVGADIGEDVLFWCQECGTYTRENKLCPSCRKELVEKKMIEIGHIFQLGTKYSLAQEAFFLDQQGQRKPLIMGCYGVGVSRLVAAIIETNCDQKGIIWPHQVSPYSLHMVMLDESLREEVIAYAKVLEQAGFRVLLDDRNESAGVKFNDALLLGMPFILVIGKKYASTKKIEVEKRVTREKFNLTQEELIHFLQNELHRDS
jgi:prolyl-tRNA synthetase